MGKQYKNLKSVATYIYPNLTILEYFNQIPKFFCCNNCDNCCERELVDYTDKIKQVVFSKKIIPFTDIFNKRELDILVNNLLISKRGNNYFQSKSLIFWIKLITVNKKQDNIPDKYKIRII